MKKIKFVTVDNNAKFCNEYNLLQSAKLNNIDIEVLGKGVKWEWFITKLKVLNEFLPNVTEEYICFTDSRDVLFLNNEEEIWKVYEKHFYNKIVFNTEMYCYPHSTFQKYYPINKIKYKYLNSGCYIGPTDKVKELVNESLIIYKEQLDNDDQSLYQKIYLFRELKQHITLDQDCILFQSLCSEDDLLFGDTTILNKHTNSSPLIFHGNGKKDMTNVVKVIGRKFGIEKLDEVFNLNLI